MNNYDTILVKCPIFKGLTIDKIVEALSTISHKVKTYKSKDTIAYHDDQCNHLFIILTGKVKGEMTDFSGKVIRIEELDAGKPLAPAFLFGQNNRYPVDIVALTKTDILVIPKTNLLLLFQQNEVILNNYLGLISNRAQFLTSRIRFLSFQTIKGKIAHYLLQLSKNEAKNTFEMKASHSELAEIFGVARPSFTRAMGELSRDKLISYEGKTVRILNKEKLIKYIQ